MTAQSPTSIHILHNVPLSPLTTIGLGGRATYFVACQSIDQVCEALRFASGRNLRVHILGGGSNVVFSDDGFNGLVIRVELKGVSYDAHGDSFMVTVAAGEEWDALIQQCIVRHLAGFECLSGIPGFVGATPIQNVGAYGQEVRDTIVSVKALDRQTLKPVEFPNKECRFGYRQSRFKSNDADKYIITEVTFRLRKKGRSEIRYPELQKFVASTTDIDALPADEPVLRTIREAVLMLRRRKSMVVDPNDLNSRSVGSFFTNPVLSTDQTADVKSRWRSLTGQDDIPTFPTGDGTKIPAAWLVEHAGFPKGYRSGGVGISQNHSLALVNYGGTTRELVDLAVRIQQSVHERFGISLEREPSIVPA